MKSTPSMTLALGGGGVKCIAHIGVLDALSTRNIQVKGIAATSAGALIAALFASGRTPNEIKHIAASFDFQRLSRRTSFDKQGLWGLSHWKKAFQALFGNLEISSLPIPVAFPLVDLETNTEFIISSGSLVDAVTAAVAIPGIFPPQLLNGRKVIDGGVLNPIPAALARSLSPASINTAIALVPPLDAWSQHPFPKLINTVPFLRILGKLRYTQALGVYIQASDLTNRLLAETRLREEKPDYVIRPDVNHLGLFDKLDFDMIFTAGKKAALQALADFDA